MLTITEKNIKIHEILSLLEDFIGKKDMNEKLISDGLYSLKEKLISELNLLIF